MIFNAKEHPHRRKNPLTGNYVLVSPHRAKRPWQGKIEIQKPETVVSYDPSCYLCPGNKRIHGESNPCYQGPYIFQNDHSALLKETPKVHSKHKLLGIDQVQGTCRVFCFSEDHSKTLSQMESSELSSVLEVLGHEILELSSFYSWIQAFENRGQMMGSSNPHPHGQIWASSALPQKIINMDRSQKKYWETNQKPLLLDYAALELEEKERVVCFNDDWLVAVPWWAEWPYETLLLPRFKVQQLHELKGVQRKNLALILKDILVRYDHLFSCSFPYSMGWYGAPFTERKSEHWQFHGSFYPPLLRSATIPKYMVGYEMFAESQRDFTPEEAAQKLQSCCN